VSYVVNNSKQHVSPETRERVEAAIRQLGYERNDLARAFRLSRTETLGLLIPNITNPLFAEAARGVGEAAVERGYTVIICNTDDDGTREQEYVRMLRLRRVDGLIATPCGSPEPFERLVRTGIRLVWLNREIPAVPADAVSGDLLAGAYTAVSYLIGKGHRRIGIIAGPPRRYTGTPRRNGYRQALLDHGLDVDLSLVRVGADRRETANRLTHELLDLADTPTAIFCVTSVYVLGAYEAIRERGLQIPADVAVLGFDDPPWARWLNPSLTCINQPGYELGVRAAHLLLDRLQETDSGPPCHDRLPNSLVVRDSA
jgi:DNA-binding LacI/PurR family transcriptional regulator